MIQVSSVYDSGEKACTGKQLVLQILHNAMDYLDKTPCRVFCLCLDKPEHVFAIKGIEHKKRSKKAAVPCPDPQEGEEVLPLDTALPYSWASMLANRTMRMAVLMKVVSLLVERFYPPVGKILVIDSSAKSGTFVIRSTGEGPYANSDHCVLLDMTVYAGELSPRTVESPEILRNRVGESDHCHLFHLTRMLMDHLEYRASNGIAAAEDPINMDVLTRDTDYIPIDLSFSRSLQEHNFHLRLCMTIQRSRQETMGPTKEVLLMDKLTEFLNKAAGNAVSRPDLSMPAAMITSDNDYVDGYYGLTPETTLTVFLQDMHYIGDLVRVTDTQDWVVDELAYLRLLKALYCHKYKSGVTKYIKKVQRKQARNADLDINESMLEIALRGVPDDSQWKSIPWPVLYHIMTDYSEKAQIPHYLTIWLRYLRLQLNVRILHKAYAEGPEGTNKLCLSHGYALIDPEKGLSKNNVRLAEQSDPFVQPTQAFLKELGMQ